MRGVIAILAFAIVLANSACAIVTSDQPGSHVVTPGELAFGINLDGVVLIGTRLPNVNTIARLLPQCSAALISDRHILCAAHCFDEDADGVVDPLLTAIPHVAAFELAEGLVMIALDAATIQFPPNWPQDQADIAVVTLADAAPAAAPRYPLNGRMDEINRTAVMAGYGDTGHGSTGVVQGFDGRSTKRAGLNRVEDIRTDLPGVEFLATDFDSGLEANNTLALIDVPSDLGFGADEVESAPGDSGGPLFINGLLAGVNSFGARLPTSDVTAIEDWSWGEVGFATRVSYFRDFLLAATGGTAVFVPEPGTISVLLTASVIGLLNRWHSTWRNAAHRYDAIETRVLWKSKTR